MTLPEIADRINGLFHRYGLDHDVVQIVHHDPPYGVVHLSGEEMHTTFTEIAIIDAHDPGTMSLLLASLDYIFATFFDVHPPTDQLRLF